MRSRSARGPLVVFATLALAGVLTAPTVGQQKPQADGTFAAQVAALSEPGGYFDTDNLISNERSYLQVLQELRRRNVRGGAYIGVGPDQNFTYIAEIRPAVAFIVDVRRDNLLLHLLFKALFSMSRTRIDYIAQLTGRAMPSEGSAWRTASIDRIVAYVEGRSSTSSAANLATLRRRVDDAIARMGVPLTAEDRATIDRFHRRFVADGMSLMFQSAGRPPQSYNPTWRHLLLETDESGRQANYLASESAFQFVKSLQERDLIIPVVGDLAGSTAIAAVAAALNARHERLSAFYVSNVEFYLFGGGTFARFAANLGRLPRVPGSVVIRSIFGRYAVSPSRPGDASVSRLQPVDELLREYAAGRIRQYADIVR